MVSTGERSCSNEYMTSHPKTTKSSSPVDALHPHLDNSHQSNSAYLYAIRLLTRREYSTPKLRRKFLDRDISPEVIEEVIERLLSADYLSNERYQEARIRGLIRKNCSPQLIQYRLQQEELTVPIDVINQQFNELKITQQDQIHILIKKKVNHMSETLDGQQKREKLIRFLSGKGHNPAVTTPILRDYLLPN
jgi:regulatory protein